MERKTAEQRQLEFGTNIGSNSGTVTVNNFGGDGKAGTDPVETYNQFVAAELIESKTDSVTIKLTPSQKIAVAAVCQKRGIGMSTFFYQAIENHLRTLPFRAKLQRYEKAICAFVENLP